MDLLNIVIRTLLLFVAVFCCSAGIAGEPFMDLHVSCVDIDERELEVTYVVDSIFQVINGQPQNKYDSLHVACESQDWSYWKATFRTGDSLNLRLEQVRGSNRGWLFGGGHGEEIVISTPADGISVRCKCDSKSDYLTRRFNTSIVDSTGCCVQSIHLVGKSASFLARLFFKEGKKAKPPSTLILRCAWMTPLNADSE